MPRGRLLLPEPFQERDGGFGEIESTDLPALGASCEIRNETSDSAMQRTLQYRIRLLPRRILAKRRFLCVFDRQSQLYPGSQTRRDFALSVSPVCFCVRLAA